MPIFTQENRQLQIATPLPQNAILIEKMSGTEGISQLYQFKLSLLIQPSLLPDSANQIPYLAFDKLLGQRVTVTLLDLDLKVERCFHGILAELSEGLPVELSENSLVQCTALLVPELWLLTQRIGSRVFQNKTVKEILDYYCKDFWGLAYTSDFLKETYEPRPLFIQHQESDFDFVSRLMQEEGIRYYFKHDTEPTTGAPVPEMMVVSDEPMTHPALLSADKTLLQLTYTKVLDPKKIDPKDKKAYVTDWKKSQTVVPARYKVRDFTLGAQDPTEPADAIVNTVMVGMTDQKLKLLDSEAPVKFDDSRRLIDFNVEAGFAERGDVWKASKKDAANRAQQAACRSLSIEGASPVVRLLPGHLVSLTELGLANGDYLITQVTHEAVIQNFYATLRVLVYGNRFSCLPKDLAYRPSGARPAEPITYPITATVVADIPKKEGDSAKKEGDVDCDKYGRVKVRFHWEEADPTSTCWLWVAQSWAGNKYGSFFIPRIGDEVLVSFLNGLKDRPVITGCVHKTQNLAPFGEFGDDNTVQVNQSVSGLRTKSLPGDDDTKFSEISIDDAKDNELVTIRANRDMKIRTEGKASIQTGISQSEIFGYDPVGAAKRLSAPGHSVATYGTRSEKTLGLATGTYLGKYNQLFIDPFNALRQVVLPKKAAAKGPMKLLLGAFGGVSTTVFGNSSRTMLYSRSRDSCRGHMTTSIRQFRPKSKLTGVLEGALTTVSLITLILPIIKANDDDNKGLATAFGIANPILTLVRMVCQGFIGHIEGTRYRISFDDKMDAFAKFMGSRSTDWENSPAKQSAKSFQEMLTNEKKSRSDRNEGDHFHNVENKYALECGDLLLASSKNVSIIANEAPGSNALKEAAAEVRASVDVLELSLPSDDEEAGRDPRTAAQQAQDLQYIVHLAGKKIVNSADTLFAALGKTVCLNSREGGDRTSITMTSKGITLKASNDCMIKVEANKITLQASPTSKIVLVDGKITIACGGASLEVETAKIGHKAAIVEIDAEAVKAL